MMGVKELEGSRGIWVCSL